MSAEWLESGKDLAINLLAGALGALAALAVTKGRAWVRLFRARHFWRAMLSEELAVVLGSHSEPATVAWERSGLLGLGDVEALISIQQQLAPLGGRCRVVPVGQLRAERRSNVVLVGGPDMNPLTAEVFDRLGQRAGFGFPDWRRHSVQIEDAWTHTEYLPQMDDRGGMLTDYGLIIRMRNPYLAQDDGQRRDVIVLAGCWGFGTAAAAEALRARQFLSDPLVRVGAEFECLVRANIAGNTLQSVDVLQVRRLRDTATESLAAR
jgi:hypothetical protein